ncbi:hypothetical protein NLG97_g3506 [Lecanicillium saksenae]|uniref:Uncharacterized protein n=1 Tax=Lecanicillium saksenae TaxID=468837 RepID=A0ACC1QXW1_9HYPO|nr:hypothetical protein NLG97_g3506 [Lecanicillium saksenae]
MNEPIRNPHYISASSPAYSAFGSMLHETSLPPYAPRPLNVTSQGLLPLQRTFTGASGKSIKALDYFHATCTMRNNLAFANNATLDRWEFQTSWSEAYFDCRKVYAVISNVKEILQELFTMSMGRNRALQYMESGFDMYLIHAFVMSYICVKFIRFLTRVDAACRTWLKKGRSIAQSLSNETRKKRMMIRVAPDPDDSNTQLV